MKKLFTILQSPGGLVIVLLLGILLGGWIEFLFLAGWVQFWTVANSWQTMIAGLLALIAAILTFHLVRTQIYMQREQAEEDQQLVRTQIELQRHQIEEEQQRHDLQQRKKSLAARAELPDALSSLSRFATECGKYILTDGSRYTPGSPRDAISAVKNSIEHVDLISARQLFELVKFYQLHNARFMAYADSGGGGLANDELCDLAHLQFLINNLFEFARGEIEVAPEPDASQSEMVTALKNCIPTDGIYRQHRRYAAAMSELERQFPL